MFEWWNCLEIVSAVNRWLQVLTIFNGFIVTVFGVASYFVSNRESALKEQFGAEQLSLIGNQVQEKLSQAESEAKKTSHLAALAEKRAQELEVQLAPWEWTSAQESSVVRDLRNIGKFKVSVGYVRSDERRNYHFADKLSKILQSGGFNVWGYLAGITPTGGPPPVGVILFVRNSNVFVDAERLASILTAAGVQAHAKLHQSLGGFSDEDVAIWVGMKP